MMLLYWLQLQQKRKQQPKQQKIQQRRLERKIEEMHFWETHCAVNFQWLIPHFLKRIWLLWRPQPRRAMPQEHEGWAWAPIENPIEWEKWFV